MSDRQPVDDSWLLPLPCGLKMPSDDELDQWMAEAKKIAESRYSGHLERAPESDREVRIIRLIETMLTVYEA